MPTAPQNDDRTTATFPTQPQEETAQPLPAYAPPLVAHHPEPRLKGRWWMVAAATLLGLVVAIGALHGRSTRVSSVGLFGAKNEPVAEAVATTPVPEEPEAVAPPVVEEPQPEATAPGEGKLSDQGDSPDVVEQGTPQGETYGFSWPDENGGTWGYEYTVPSDPDSGGSYSFTWPDEQGGEHGHEFSYRYDDDSMTFEYDGQEYSLDLDDLEWLLDPGEGYGDSYGYGYDEVPGELGGYGDLQMPGYDGDPSDNQMPGHENPFGSW